MCCCTQRTLVTNSKLVTLKAGVLGILVQVVTLLKTLAIKISRLHKKDKGSLSLLTILGLAEQR